MNWREYSKSKSPRPIYDESRLVNYEDGSYFLSFCRFIHQTDLGAVRIGPQYNETIEKQNVLIVEDTYFYQCSSAGETNYGGSLYYNSDGHCIHQRVCYYNSKKNDGEYISY